MNRINSSPAARADASRINESWNHRREDARYVDRKDFPETMSPIGQALEVMYWSSKWCRQCGICDHAWVPMDRGKPKCPECGSAKTEPSDRVFELYRHDCESRPTVYASGPGESTLDVLRLDSWRTEVADLGIAEELTIQTDSGCRCISLKRSMLRSLPDRRTVVIVSERGTPYVIRGGKFRVTADGLVN